MMGGSAPPSDFRGTLVAMYQVVDVSRVAKVDGVLQKYRGRFGMLVDRLRKKYAINMQAQPFLAKLQALAGSGAMATGIASSSASSLTSQSATSPFGGGGGGGAFGGAMMAGNSVSANASTFGGFASSNAPAAAATQGGFGASSSFGGAGVFGSTGNAGAAAGWSSTPSGSGGLFSTTGSVQGGNGWGNW